MSNPSVSARDAVVISLLSLSYKGKTGKTSNLKKWFMKSAAMDTDIRSMECFLKEVSGLINESNISIDMCGDLPSAVFEISKDMREFYEEYMINIPIHKKDILDRLKQEYGEPKEIDDHTYQWRHKGIQLKISLVSDVFIFYEIGKVYKAQSEIVGSKLIESGSVEVSKVLMIASGTIYGVYNVKDRIYTFIKAAATFGFGKK